MRKRRVGEEIQSPVASALSPAGTPAPTPPPGEQLSEPEDGDEEDVEAAARRWRLQAIPDLTMDQALNQALEATLWDLNEAPASPSPPTPAPNLLPPNNGDSQFGYSDSSMWHIGAT